MKIKYVGAPDDGIGDGQPVEAFGRTLAKGKAFEVPDDHPEAYEIAMRVDGNPHFAFEGARPKLQPPSGPLAMNPQPIADPATYAAKA